MEDLCQVVTCEAGVEAWGDGPRGEEERELEARDGPIEWLVLKTTKRMEGMVSMCFCILGGRIFFLQYFSFF